MASAYGAGVQRSMPFLLTGGISGAGARWGVGEVLSSPAAALLAVNTIGSLILGVVTVLGREQREDSSGARPLSHVSPIRLGLTVGFCGGLTTFSELAVDLVSRWREGAVGAPALAVASVGIGLTAVIVGRLLGRRLDWTAP